MKIIIHIPWIKERIFACDIWSRRQYFSQTIKKTMMFLLSPVINILHMLINPRIMLFLMYTDLTSCITERKINSRSTRYFVNQFVGILQKLTVSIWLKKSSIFCQNLASVLPIRDRNFSASNHKLTIEH